MLQRAMRACGQRFGLPSVLLGYCLLLLCFAAPDVAQSAGVGKVAVQANASSTQVELEGELEVLHEDDFKNRKSRIRHFLKTVAGERYELKFSQRAPHYPSGSKVRVRGSKSGNLLALDSGSGSTQVLALPASNTLGEQKTAVLLVNFQAYPVQPFTSAAVNDMVFNATSRFYKENSDNQTWLSGQVFGWYTMPIAFTCDTSSIAAAARQQAADAGVDLTPFARVVYLFPQNGACSWSGVGSVGGASTEAWINGELNVKVIGHELGHNLGLYHAHALECGSSTLATTCSAIEYGDGSDIMGNLAAVHFSAFQKQRLGWLNDGAAAQLQTVTSSGSYTLDPYEVTGGIRPRALRVLKSIDASSGKKSWYYIEYRQPLGFDSALPSLYNSNLVKGVQLRIATDDEPNSSHLLDMTPSSSAADDMNDAALVPGASYSDSNAGVSITLNWADSGSAGVTINFAQQSCVRKAPAVSVASSQSGSVAAGSSVSYTVAVSNQDSSACPASTVALASVLPTGWSGSFASQNLTLAAGSAGSTTLQVSSPDSASAGSYGIAVSASTAAGSSSATASYSIASSQQATLSSAVATDKSSYAKGAVVTATTTVLAGGKPLANASVQLLISKPNGSTVSQALLTGSNGQAVYKLRLGKKDPAGLYQVKASASSAGQTVQAGTSFSVQ
ncbi:NEW3 domain-containing protein [Vogesella indigofera]|uniref:NEW3 domain-containing protein n=1 Tax=Vogesella indigofera TaxID=45465 RepID=UPI00234F78D7|nr:NEW3 domain-containing protein [Vogesella indigofera]MDC7710974.1 NEW3 domain-containing protein [Vogesella indigofera]